MKITKNWSLDTTGEGCTLMFQDLRIRESGKDTGKEYLFTDNFYYNNVHQALKAYLNKSLEDSVDVKDCVDKIEKSLLKIESLSF